MIQHGDDGAPLLSIERQVLERARELDLPAGEEAGPIRAMVVQAVETWADDHKRGVRSVGVPDPDALVDRAVRNLTGYGPLAPLLQDDDVWEVMINAPTARLRGVAALLRGTCDERERPPGCEGTQER